MPIVQRVATKIREQSNSDTTGHDWHHVNRVWRIARHIAVCEHANLEVVELGALVHDIADWKFHGGDDNVGPRRAEELLSRAGASAPVVDAVVDIVATISFKGAGVPSSMRTIEGKCVQDADRLDALGAIGIARCFAYGGHVGRALHDPSLAPVLHQSADSYKSSKGTSLNHFYEKLFLLKDRMNTKSGRILAEERHRFMQGYVARFLAEWDCEVDHADDPVPHLPS